MKTKLIKVTKTNIKNGLTGDCHNCPVALAVRREFRLKEHQVDVSGGLINFCVKKSVGYEYQDFEHPKEVAEFIDKFDSGEKVKPFSFVMKYD